MPNFGSLVFGILWLIRAVRPDQPVQRAVKGQAAGPACSRVEPGHYYPELAEWLREVAQKMSMTGAGQIRQEPKATGTGPLPSLPRSRRMLLAEALRLRLAEAEIGPTRVSSRLQPGVRRLAQNISKVRAQSG
jgi:hypothetical protein